LKKAANNKTKQVFTPKENQEIIQTDLKKGNIKIHKAE
jgi:hypothetical protein